MIVGTAGHVDHGKTSLVRALTGIDTDRLAEEKARGITIDLGFAYMAMPGGGTLGFVDVPGHERLVRTMVAGAAGIDFALVAIAADDGPMPQTREHLAILDLLGLTRGIVVVTKCDRVDAARRAAVATEISIVLERSALASVDLVFVSARSGEGIDALHRRLVAEASALATAKKGGTFRLPVDRVFTLNGVGTVATGTALQGKVRVGDEVLLLPSGRRARVRSLRVGSLEAIEGRAGERLALALAGPGVGRDALQRGAWICSAANASMTSRVDADLELLATESHPLKDGASVRFHAGAGEELARTILLEGAVLSPGSVALAQLVLTAPVPLRRGDVFVLRDVGAQRTIGGGRVLDVRPPLRRRRAPERLARLHLLRIADPAELLRRLLELSPGIEDYAAFRDDNGITLEAGEALCEDLELERITDGDAEYVASRAGWAALRARTDEMLGAFHSGNPELPGMANERLRSALGLTKSAFAAVRARLIAEKQMVGRGHWLHRPGHVPELAEEDKRLAALIRPRLSAAERFRPPRVRDMSSELGVAEPTVRRTCKTLARAGELLEIARDHFFERRVVAEMAQVARGLSGGGAMFSVADFRDSLGNGRKVAIQILEFFDHHGVTRREGDLRRVVGAPELVFGRATDES